jgi:hypothetical protein
MQRYEKQPMNLACILELFYSKNSNHWLTLAINALIQSVNLISSDPNTGLRLTGTDEILIVLAAVSFFLFNNLP